MSRNKMDRPYCTINGKRYKLYIDNNGTVRFPDDGRPMPDLNKMALDYIKGKIPLSENFEYYINSGSSYYLVEGLFSRRGMNNHMTTQGKEPTKYFRYYGEKH